MAGGLVTSIAGAIRVAAVSRIRRCQLSVGAGAAAGSDSERIDGWSAVAPMLRKKSTQPRSIAPPGTQPTVSWLRP